MKPTPINFYSHNHRDNVDSKINKKTRRLVMDGFDTLRTHSIFIQVTYNIKERLRNETKRHRRYV